jgi:hypothetical protein
LTRRAQNFFQLRIFIQTPQGSMRTVIGGPAVTHRMEIISARLSSSTTPTETSKSEMGYLRPVNGL